MPLHYGPEGVPRVLTLTGLYRVAIFCEKYGFVHVLAPWFTTWVGSLEGTVYATCGEEAPGAHEFWIRIRVALRQRDKLPVPLKALCVTSSTKTICDSYLARDASLFNRMVHLEGFPLDCLG